MASPSADSATVPISAVSAAPTMATPAVRLTRRRGRNNGSVTSPNGLERHFEREVERELLGVGRDVDQVGQQPGALLELHLRDHVRRFEAGSRRGG